MLVLDVGVVHVSAEVKVERDELVVRRCESAPQDCALLHKCLRLLAGDDVVDLVEDAVVL